MHASVILFKSYNLIIFDGMKIVLQSQILFTFAE